MSVKNVTGTHQALPISETPKITITSLADELLLNTAQQGVFSPKETARLQRVNKQFREVFSSNELWNNLLAPRVAQPLSSAQSGKEPPLLFEEILGMSPVERRTLGSIWEKPACIRQETWPYELMRLHSNNRQIVYALVQKQGLAIRDAAAEFQRDKTLALAAVKQNGLALEHLAPELRADKEVVLAAVRQNGEALRWAEPALKADKEVVIAAVRQNGEALRWAASALRADKEVVLAAVTQNGGAVIWAEPALKADKEIMLAAIKQDLTVYYHASDALLHDPDIIRAHQDGERAIMERLQNDYELVLLALRTRAGL